MAFFLSPLPGRYNWHSIGICPLIDPFLLVDFAAIRKYLVIWFFGYNWCEFCARLFHRFINYLRSCQSRENHSPLEIETSR